MSQSSKPKSRVARGSQQHRPSMPERRSILSAQIPGLSWWALRLGRWGLLLGLAALLTGLWESRLVSAVGTDGLIYHLTLPARWLQQGYLAPQDLPFHDGVAQFSPMLSESLCYLLMSLTGDEHLCWLIQPVFLLVLAYFFYRSARLMGTRSPLALLLTGMVLLFEPFDSSAVIVNNDIILASGAARAARGMCPRNWPWRRPCWWLDASSCCETGPCMATRSGRQSSSSAGT